MRVDAHATKPYISGARDLPPTSCGGGYVANGVLGDVGLGEGVREMSTSTDGLSTVMGKDKDEMFRYSTALPERVDIRPPVSRCPTVTTSQFTCIRSAIVPPKSSSTKHARSAVLHDDGSIYCQLTRDVTVP
jgi:hypothetical protein